MLYRKVSQQLATAFFRSNSHCIWVVGVIPSFVFELCIVLLPFEIFAAWVVSPNFWAVGMSCCVSICCCCTMDVACDDFEYFKFRWIFDADYVRTFSLLKWRNFCDCCAWHPLIFHCIGCSKLTATVKYLVFLRMHVSTLSSVKRGMFAVGSPKGRCK